jgi:hypothetical protein
LLAIKEETMSITEYLESSPLSGLVVYGPHNALNAVPFVGTLRKHPYDSEKCLLLTAKQEKLRWLEEGKIIEFKIGDVFAVDELASPVDESGSARSLVRLWVRKGAFALSYEPFEVGDTHLGPRESPALRSKLSHIMSARSNVYQR